MADWGLLLKRGSCRSTWLRVRKARPQLILSRRPRRRLGSLRWCGRRRLRRRLLQAQAAGVDWREGARQVSRAAAAGRPNTATPSPIPSPTPASEPESEPELESASSCHRPLLIPPVRPVGPGRALLLLPVEQDRRWSMQNFSPQCSIVLLEHLKTATVNFITSYPGSSYIFVQESPTPQIKPEYLALRSVGIRREKKRKGLQLTESTLSALEELVNVSCEEVDGCPVILVCGSQDVGKSTFNRYLINQLLNSLPCVDYLECDLGQTEFTPPGCISLLNITEPVLGAPFTHLRTPQKMVYYGKPSCKNNYENYIDIVKYVFSAYKRESPLVVNTMGWVSDQGLLLLIDLIRLLSPSHVVQFRSDHSKYMPDLTPQYVDDMDGLYTKSKTKMRNRRFRLAAFADALEFADEEKESPVEFTGHKLIGVYTDFAFRITPRNRESHNKILRDLSILSYLSQLQPPMPKPLSPLHSLTPYQVPFNAVALRITHSDVAPTHILYAVNASWVGLCKIQDDVRGYTNGPILLAQTPICDCLGFGICRGIDMEKRLYHILTPVPPEELRTVNCLLVGAIAVPHCVLKCQRGIEGTVPYVTTDYNFKLPGASEKIGAREPEEAHKEKPYRRPKFCRKMK
uniref:Polynucleotide 5'-hydroxyl-kinase NOL9 n=1 Tax=Gorilla gorilla gorilla TaxID=9595 RepID=G3S2H1_GORGO